MGTYTYTYTSRPRALPCQRRRYRDTLLQPCVSQPAPGAPAPPGPLPLPLPLPLLHSPHWLLP